MKILILGSEGTLGRYVSNIFCNNGHDVIPWDIKLGSNYDLRVSNSLESIIDKIDFIIFLAFDVGGAKYNMNNLDFMNNNIEIMYNTFAIIKKYKKPFIYTTSTMSNMDNNIYSILKRLSEFYVTFLNGISVKLWNVYGDEPINDKSHVITDLIYQAITSDKIILRTNGQEERLFLHSHDFANAIYDIFSRYDILKTNKIIDISSTNWITILQVAEIVKKYAKNIMNKDITIVTSTIGADSHTRKNQPDLSIIEKYWKPIITIEVGIELMFKHMIKEYL
jgi:nucleoside-diphosphate-sugar epimerase